MKLFMHIYEIGYFEWFSHERDNAWKKKVVLNTFFFEESLKHCSSESKIKYYNPSL